MAPSLSMATDDGAFDFVLHEPNAALSNENRSKIRRHAMRAVRSERAAAKRGESLPSNRYPLQRQLQPAPVSGLELLVKDFGLNPMDLSALTSVHLGAIASSTIKEQPGRLGGVLSCRQRSYMSFLPLHFGHLEALDDAFRSLITAAHMMLVETQPGNVNRNDKILAHYGKALRSLQSAVNDPQKRWTTEVLCAVALLALFEILHPSTERLWHNHVEGASRLIQARGPQSFTSDFDLALLTGLIYPITAEALFNNTDCFLDSDIWRATVRTAIDSNEDFSDRSPLGIELMLLMVSTPGLARRTSCVVDTIDLQVDRCNLSAGLEADVRSVYSEAHSLRQKVIAWRADFNTALIHSTPTGHGGDAEQYDTRTNRYELLGIYSVVHILADRMLVSLSGPEGEYGAASVIEDEVQTLAAELRQTLDTVPPINSNHRAKFNLRQKALVADAAIATHDEFRTAAIRGRNAGRVIDRNVLKRFCVALGRRC